jgi:hypothetical protein
VNKAVTNDMLDGLEARVAARAGAVKSGYESAVVLANVAVSQDKLNESCVGLAIYIFVEHVATIHTTNSDSFHYSLDQLPSVRAAALWR